MTQDEQQKQSAEQLAKLYGAKTLISETDEHLIRSVFGPQIEPYMALRNLLFGFVLDDNEKSLLKPIQSPQFKNLLRKLFLPEVKNYVPVGHNKDLWVTMDFDDKVVNEENFATKYETKTLFLGMLEQALARIEDFDKPGVDLSVKQNLPALLARNSFIGYVENKILHNIMVLGTKKIETPEEAVMRLKKDSNK